MASDGGVGSAKNIQITGCNHATVGNIVRGNFTLCGENHGKPAYKKDQQVNGLDVMMYFWDQRDGANFSGWWFGPKVGGDQVWAYHNTPTQTPPCNGWRVPYDGPVDPSMVIAPVGAQPQQGMGGQQAGQMNRLQQMQQQQQQMQAQRQAQQQQQQSAVQNKQAEQKALVEIRKKLMNLRGASIDNIEKLKAELQEVYDKELPNTGSQRGAIEQEAAKALEAANAKVETQQKQKAMMEEKKAEAAAKLKEQQDKAEQLIDSFVQDVDAAEKVCNAVKEASEPLQSQDITEAKIAAIGAALDAAIETAKEKVKSLNEWKTANHADVAAAGKIPGAPLKEKFEMYQKTLTKLQTFTNQTNAAATQATQAKEKAVKRIAALAKKKEFEQVFTKYDKNKDQHLNKAEVTEYAKKEFKVTLSPDYITGVLKQLDADGTKGVKKEKFHGLKVACGVWKELEKDKIRKAEREEREKELAAMKEKLQAKVTDTEELIKTLDEPVKAVEEAVKPLTGKTADMPCAEIEQKATEADGLIATAKEKMATLKAEAEGMKEGCEKELSGWLNGEVRKLTGKLGDFSRKVDKAEGSIKRCRDNLKRRIADELKKLKTQVVKMLKHHKKAKDISGEDFFAAVDTNKDDSIDESEFVAFMKTCEKDNGAEPPSEEDLARVFKDLTSEEETSISKSAFLLLVRCWMKVITDTVLTKEVSIESETLRRLEANEVVDVLKAPVKDEATDVERVYVKCMKDDQEGWISIKGNAGSVFLKEGGYNFKVKTATILTAEFDLEADAVDTGGSPQKKPRKLKEGETVEVLVWPKKEPKSELLRMHCRCTADGATGWVTTTGNTGTVYLEVV